MHSSISRIFTSLRESQILFQFEPLIFTLQKNISFIAKYRGVAIRMQGMPQPQYLAFNAFAEYQQYLLTLFSMAARLLGQIGQCPRPVFWEFDVSLSINSFPLKIQQDTCSNIHYAVTYYQSALYILHE